MELQYEMTYAERISGPFGPTTGSPLGTRLAWTVEAATLRGPRIDATLAAPGMDWLRLSPDGARRQDLRAILATADGATILMHYDNAWLTDSLFVGEGRLAGPRRIEYDVYRVD